jgi:hypothetical protein
MGTDKLTVSVNELLDSQWLLISHQVATRAPVRRSGIMFVVNHLARGFVLAFSGIFQLGYFFLSLV